MLLSQWDGAVGDTYWNVFVDGYGGADGDSYGYVFARE